MKKLLNSALNRFALVSFLLLVQIAMLGMVLVLFREYFVYFYIVGIVVSILTVLYIINNKSNPAYKIAWIIPIMLLPIFGGLFYLMLGKNRLSDHKRDKTKSIQQQYDAVMLGYEDAFQQLAEEDAEAALHSKYILKSAVAPVYRQTESKFLPSGEVMYQRMIEELMKAEKFIFLEYFIIEEGRMWNSIFDILEEKVKQGVDVRLMYDDFGCLLTLPDDYVQVMEGKGIKACVFNRFNPVLSLRFNNRDHRKLCVIDGKVGFTGGINLADEYINIYEKYGHWLDCGIMLKGAAVWSLTVMFLSVWDYVRRENDDFYLFAPDIDYLNTIKDDGYVQPFTDTPLDDEPVGELVYMNLINRAKKYVYINTPYLIIDNEMVTALTTTAKCGIDVRIVLPFIPDKRLAQSLTRSNYQILLEAGVRIFEYTPGFVHSKTFVVDDEYAVVGTINLDFRSLFLHFECAAWLYKCSCIAHIKADYLKTLEKCREITLEECRDLPLWRRLGRAVLRVIAPLF